MNNGAFGNKVFVTPVHASDEKHEDNRNPINEFLEYLQLRISTIYELYNYSQ